MFRKLTLATLLLFALNMPCKTFAVAGSRETVPAKKSRPTSPLKVSKETTFIIQPLRQDGTVDFLEHLNRQLSKGVTPQNNAAVPIAKALGVDYLPESEAFRKEFFKRLGIQPPQSSSEIFQPFTPPGETGDSQDPWEAFNAALNSPWTADQYPGVARWIKRNEKPLAQMTEGLKRSRFYLPLVVDTQDEQQMQLMIAVMLPTLQQQRSFARALKCRAMMHLGEKRYQFAADDLLSCHRLARHLAQGPTMIDGLVAIAVDSMAAQGDNQFIAETAVPAEIYQTYRQRLTQLGDLPDMARCIDQVERLFFVDVIQFMSRNRTDDVSEVLELGGPVGRALQAAGPFLIDWNYVARTGNQYYDRLVKIARMDSFADQQAMFDKLDQEFAQWKKPTDVKSLAWKTLFGGSLRQQTSDYVSKTLMALLIPSVRQVTRAELRSKSTDVLVTVGLALAEFRARNGQYPDTLAELTPNLLKTLPQDPYTNGPLRYRPTATGFKLYCVGENLQDDNGIDRMTAHAKDDQGFDIVLETPIPQR